MSSKQKISRKIASLTMCLLMLFMSCLASVPLYLCSSRGELCFTKLSSNPQPVKSCCCCSNSYKSESSISKSCCQQISQKFSVSSVQEVFSFHFSANVENFRIKFTFPRKINKTVLDRSELKLAGTSPPIYLLKQSLLT